MERIARLIEKSPKGFSRLPYIVQIVLVAAVYYLAAWVGLSFAFTADQVSVVWPPTGLALAVILLLGYRLWPGIALGAFLANASFNVPALVVLGISVGNTLEALAGAWMIRRFTGFEASLGRVKDVFALIVFGVLLSTTISATVGVTSLCLGGVQPWSAYNSLWMLWWWGDGMGDLVVAPLLLTWAVRSSAQWSRREVADYGVLLLSLYTVGMLLFNPDWAVAKQFPPSVLVFPVTIVAALRLGPAGVSLTTFVLCTLAVINTVLDSASGADGDIEARLLSLQVFMGTAAISGLLLAATNSERRALTAAVRASEERMRYTLDAAHVGTWEWDMNSGLVHWSENMEAIHQSPPGSFGGKFEDFLRDIHPEDRERVIQAVLRALEEGDIYHEEYRQLRPDGGVIWLEAKGRAYYGPDRRPLRMAGICMDTSDRKNLELRLKDLTDDLERKVKDRTAEAEKRAAQLQSMASQLTQVETRERRRLAHILHDGLQQLLVGAKFNVSRIRKYASDRQVVLETTGKLDEILKECIHASRSLSQELTPPGLHDRNLDAALRGLAREMKDLHGLQVDLDIEGETPGLTEDSRTFLYQAVREILFNVVKHAHVDRAKVQATREGQAIKIEISDSGKGFDTRGLESSEIRGLGLISIRERIGLMGGRLEINSASGKGSRFVLVMPCDGEIHDRAPETPIALPRPQRLPEIVEAHSDGQTRVLLVDDHRLMREGLAMLLCEESDLSIVGVATDGIEAIAMARKLHPDVIVMDITMPGMDGIEATRCIHTEFPDIQIVGLSMHENADTAKRMQEAGAKMYLTKDGSPDFLLEAIRSGR